MRLFLDTEFNEFKGPLISMALFPEDRGLARLRLDSMAISPNGDIRDQIRAAIAMVKGR